MAASAGTLTVTSTGQKVFQDADGCTTFLVRVRSTSGNGALVNIAGLHEPADFFSIPIGGEVMFRLFNLGIREVFVKGDGGDSIIDYGVVAKTAKT